jgi:predicted NBD/HSP70 family sugar kinase
MKILVIDIGGTNVKLWKTSEFDKVKVPSGRQLTPPKLIEDIRKTTADTGDWHFDRVSIGYPGDVLNGHPVAEPYNLGSGWVDFDFPQALGCPVRIMNDACMQALGSYEGGRMLYLGLGTSLGSAFMIDHKIVPLSLGHLRFRRGNSYEQTLSREGLKRRGQKEWLRAVTEACVTLKAAFAADYIVLGGGNSKRVKMLPPGCRRGGNHHAYLGGIRMWEPEAQSPLPAEPDAPPPNATTEGGAPHDTYSRSSQPTA